MTVDLGDISPLATYPLIPGTLYTAVVGVYSGGSNSNANNMFQLWALGGSYLGPAVPGVAPPTAPGSTPGTPGTPSAPGSTPSAPGTPKAGSGAASIAVSALVVLAALFALLL